MWPIIQNLRIAPVPNMTFPAGVTFHFARLVFEVFAASDNDHKGGRFITLPVDATTEIYVADDHNLALWLSSTSTHFRTKSRYYCITISVSKLRGGKGMLTLGE
jgi:hypothetical protein